MKLVNESNDINFEWKRWVSVSMTIVKLHNKAVRKEKESEGKASFVGPEDFIKKIATVSPSLINGWTHVDRCGETRLKSVMTTTIENY